MKFLSDFLVSVSMAVDCMTIGATDGIQEPDMKLRKSLLIAFFFGLFQGVMPVIGYFIGYGFKGVLEKYIPWIAFALLTFLGIKNIVEWIKERKEEKTEATEVKEVKKLTLPTILLQSVATSIDALSIGFVYLDSEIFDAMMVFLLIGVVTFILSFIALLLGKKIGSFLEKWAGLLAGIVFLIIGIKILLEGVLPSSDTLSLFLSHLK